MTKRALHIALVGIIAAASLSGVLLNGGLYLGTFRPEIFKTFTALSNAYVFVYYLPYFVRLLRGDSALHHPAWYLSVLVSIFQTGAVAAIFRMGAAAGSPKWFVTAMFYLHVVVPAAVLLEFLAFAEKGKLKFRYLPIAALPLSLYGLTAVLAPLFGFYLGSGGAHYPYPFLDAEALGVPMILLILAASLAGILFISTAFTVYDKLLAKGLNKKLTAV